jgi:hypothetical protein
MRILSLVGLTSLAVAATFAPAHAQSRMQAGILECVGGPSGSYIVGSVRQLSCVFRPQSGRPSTYVAVLQRAGVDVGFTSASGVNFAVLAPAGRVRRGALVGSYGGLSAGAAVGVGARGNWLVGGPQNAIALQPLSVEGQTGLNAAAGFAGLELRKG